ncbi:MAG TPA: hypothetical protein VMF59_02125 [Bacteroidota bacterium]|nr:hypothetical protein [Bacteroidota bacterium]
MATSKKCKTDPVENGGPARVEDHIEIYPDDVIAVWIDLIADIVTKKVLKQEQGRHAGTETRPQSEATDLWID